MSNPVNVVIRKPVVDLVIGKVTPSVTIEINKAGSPGAKGDPFLYEDFTPEQLLLLQANHPNLNMTELSLGNYQVHYDEATNKLQFLYVGV